MFQIYRKLKWAYQKFRVSYSLPFFVLVSYTLLGAVIFRKVELEEDVKRRADYRNSTEFAFNQVLKKIISIRCNDTVAKVDPELATRHAKEALFWFIDYLNLTQIIEERSSNTPWTWMGSAFYSGQLYTTIGYGYPLVHTSTGQVVTIFYIMIGIPIFLIILKDVGKLLSRALRKIYKRWRTAKNKIPDNAVRRMSEPVKAIYSLAGNGNSNSPTKSMTDNTVSGEELESPTQLKQTITETTIINEDKQNEMNMKLQKGYANFPIPLALFILVAWITLSAALFCVWETEWGYLTSVYFFFVSISTVGLGDIVPSKPDMMLVNFVLILIGLALLSMCINLIQDAIERIIEQLLQEYIEEIEKIAAIVTTDTDFVEETATPFEVGISTDLLTAPLTAIREEQEPWFRGIPQKAKDWMAEKVVDKLLIQQLDPESSSSDEDDEPEELEEVVVSAQRGISPEKMSSQKDAVSKASKKKKKRLFRRRGNFSLNYNLPTLRTIQAMEKVKINTKSDNSFRGRLFAKFATNKKFNKYLDEHVVEPTFQTTNASVVGTIVGDPQKFNVENSPSSWKVKLVTPESTVPSMKGSTGTASTYDLDSLYSMAYNDVTFGYSTDSVPKLIAQEQKQKEEEMRIEKLKQRRASKDSLPPVPPMVKEIIAFPPPLAEIDESGVKIKVNESSDSPEPTCSYSLDPWGPFPSARRASSPGFLGSPQHLHDPRSRMPMMRCPSCLHMATAPSTVPQGGSSQNDPDLEAMKRIKDICGLLPGDFTPLDRRKQKSPSPSQVEDSGYGNSLATDKSSLMTDSTFMATSMTPSILRTQLEDEDEKNLPS